MNAIKNIKTIKQFQKAIETIKPVSITNIYERHSSIHNNTLKIWKSETESVDYMFNHDCERTQEYIEYRIALATATPLELLTALF